MVWYGTVWYGMAWDGMEMGRNESGWDELGWDGIAVQSVQRLSKAPGCHWESLRGLLNGFDSLPIQNAHFYQANYEWKGANGLRGISGAVPVKHRRGFRGWTRIDEVKPPGHSQSFPGGLRRHLESSLSVFLIELQRANERM